MSLYESKAEHEERFLLLTENKEVACWPLSASRVTFSCFCDLSLPTACAHLSGEAQVLVISFQSPSWDCIQADNVAWPSGNLPLPGENSCEAEGWGRGALWKHLERLPPLVGLATMEMTSVLESMGHLCTLEAGSFRGL